ncbi:MAG: phosphoribosylglycinamide formyltransferase [Dehalococcoidia bacterium]|nr:phosphoribosylglycinamide formyltransferase [Dehalococcoidia bacterium]
MTVRLAVLLSGTGRTLQNFVREIEAGRLDARIQIVVASNARSFNAEAVRQAGVPVEFVERRRYESVEAFSEAITAVLDRHEIDLVVQAGLLQKYLFPERLKGRVLNVHPALLPKFGGQGMYGHHVHEAVLASGDTESGCTVHITDEEYDHGPIVLQRRVPVLPGDTPETLAERVFEAECEAYPEAVRLLAGRLGPASVG